MNSYIYHQYLRMSAAYRRNPTRETFEIIGMTCPWCGEDLPALAPAGHQMCPCCGIAMQLRGNELILVPEPEAVGAVR